MKTYFFKINPNDVLAELVFVENRGEWLLQFFIDLKNGDPEKATSSLATEIIKEAHEYRAKKAEAGKNGGLAKASSAKQNLAVLDSAKTEVKQNVANSSSNNNSSKPKTYCAEAVRLSSLLADTVLINYPDYRELQIEKKQGTIERWSIDIDKLMRIDNQPAEEIEKVIKWVGRDDFWKANILSGNTLRKQWDKLKIKMIKDTPKADVYVPVWPAIANAK